MIVVSACRRIVVKTVQARVCRIRDVGVRDDPQSAIRVLGAIIGICTYFDPLANITSATIDRTMRTNASLCSFMPSQI